MNTIIQIHLVFFFQVQILGMGLALLFKVLMVPTRKMTRMWCFLRLVCICSIVVTLRRRAGKVEDVAMRKSIMYKEGKFKRGDSL